MFKSDQVGEKRRFSYVLAFSTGFYLLLNGLQASALKTPAKDSAANNSKALYIEGTSDIFVNFKATALQSNIHIVSRLGGSIWKEQAATVVTVYNNENKVFFKQPAEAYLTELTQDFLPIPIEEFEPPAKTVFEGRPAKKYRGYAKVGKMGRQCVAEMTCIENNWLTPGAHRMWCRVLGLNRFDFGLPVLLTQRRASIVSYDAKVVKLGRPVWVRVLVTNKIKEVPAPIGTFAINPNWKQAKDKAGLLFSRNGNLEANDIDDFFRSKTK